MKIKKILLFLLTIFVFFTPFAKTNAITLDGPFVSETEIVNIDKESQIQIDKINGEKAKEEALSKLDPREVATWSNYNSGEYGLVTNVVTQGQKEICWAYGTAAATESGILKDHLKGTNGKFRISPDNIAYTTTNRISENDPLDNTYNDTFHDKWNQGFDVRRAVERFSQWVGPHKTENDYEQGDTNFYKPEYVLENTLEIDNKNRNDIKRAIAERGAVTFVYNSYPTAAAFYNSDGLADSEVAPHAASIIGWDDNISPVMFSNNGFKKPSQPGGWLIKNSWGDYYGSNGLFYLSYDSPIGDIIGLDFKDYQDNLNNYYYDGILSDNSNVLNTDAAVIFEAKVASDEVKEILDEVEVKIDGKNITLNVDIYVDVDVNPGNRISKDNNPTSGVHVSSGKQSFWTGGHKTIKLDTPVELRRGQFYSVVVSAKNNTNDAGIYMSYEPMSYNDLSFYKNESNEWENTFFNNHGVARIKAHTYTVKKENIGTKDINNADAIINKKHYQEGDGLYRNETPIVTYKGEQLRENEHYVLSYQEKFETPKNTYDRSTIIGSGRIIITGINEFKGTSKVLYYPIIIGEYPNLETVGTLGATTIDITVDESMHQLKDVLLPNGWVWNNPEEMISFDKTFNNAISYEGKDKDHYKFLNYDVYFYKASDATINISNKLIIQDLNKEYTYNGSRITPNFKLFYNNNLLNKNEDYKIEYVDNIEVGTAKIIIRGINNYIGTQIFTFKIKKADNMLSSFEVYNNKPYAVTRFGEVKFNYYSDQECTQIVSKPENGKTYYVLPYVNNGKSYNGLVLDKNIKGKKIVYSNEVIEDQSLIKDFKINGTYIYDGTIKDLDITVYDLNGKKLNMNSDYKINYITKDRINAGTIMFNIEGLGKYKGSLLESSYDILPIEANESELTFNGFKDSLEFNNKNKQEFEILYNGKVLNSSNYIINYSNNEHVGKATINITFLNNFNGTITKEYTITQANNKFTNFKTVNGIIIAESLFGEVKYEYQNLDTGEIFNKAPSKPGKYDVRIYVTETKDYKGIEIIKHITLGDIQDKVNYTINVRSTTKGLFEYCFPHIIISKDGNEYFNEYVDRTNDQLVTITVLLEPGIYDVKVEINNPGYIYEKEHTISLDDGVYPYDTSDKYPTIDIYIKGELRKGKPDINQVYKKSELVHNLEFVDFEGFNHNLSYNTSQGKMTVFVFYKPGCPYGRYALEALNNLGKEYKDYIKVYGISMYYSYGDSQNNAYQFEYIRFVEGYNTNLMNYFGAESSPTITFIDKEGVFCENLYGASSAENCKKNVTNTLNRYLTKDIEKESINGGKIVIKNENSFVFNNSLIKPEIEVQLNGTILSSDNYTVKYDNNFNAGTATIIVTAIGEKYEGSITTTFIISKAINKITNFNVDNSNPTADSLFGTVKF